MNKLDTQRPIPADTTDELTAQVLMPAKPAYHRSTVVLSVFLAVVVIGLLAYMAFADGGDNAATSGQPAESDENRGANSQNPAIVEEVSRNNSDTAGADSADPVVIRPDIATSPAPERTPEVFQETVRVQGPTRLGTPDIATVDSVTESTIAGLPVLILEFRGGHPDCVSYTAGVEESITEIQVSLVSWTRTSGAPAECDAVVAMETSVALAAPIEGRNLVIYEGD